MTYAITVAGVPLASSADAPQAVGVPESTVGEESTRKELTSVAKPPPPVALDPTGQVATEST
jgi:hypothetical protein